MLVDSYSYIYDDDVFVVGVDGVGISDLTVDTASVGASVISAASALVCFHSRREKAIRLLIVCLAAERREERYIKDLTNKAR